MGKVHWDEALSLPAVLVEDERSLRRIHPRALPTRVRCPCNRGTPGPTGGRNERQRTDRDLRVARGPGRHPRLHLGLCCLYRNRSTSNTRALPCVVVNPVVLTLVPSFAPPPTPRPPRHSFRIGYTRLPPPRPHTPTSRLRGSVLSGLRGSRVDVHLSSLRPHVAGTGHPRSSLSSHQDRESYPPP